MSFSFREDGSYMVKTRVKIKEGKCSTSLTKYVSIRLKINKKTRNELLKLLTSYQNLVNKGLKYVEDNYGYILRKCVDKKGNFDAYKLRDILTDYLSSKWEIIKRGIIDYTSLWIAQKVKEQYKKNKKFKKFWYRDTNIYLHQRSINDIDFDNQIVKLSLFNPHYNIHTFKFFTDENTKKLLQDYINNKQTKDITKKNYPNGFLKYKKSKKSFYLLLPITFSYELPLKPYNLGIDLNKDMLLAVYSSKTNESKFIELDKNVLEFINTKKEYIQQLKTRKYKGKWVNRKIFKTRKLITQKLLDELRKVVFREIFQTYYDHNIVIEDLSGLTKYCVSKYNIYPGIFMKNILFNGFVKYKVPVILKDPKNTSRKCPECGYIDKRNRKKDIFVCIECGYTENSHKVAAKNISNIDPETDDSTGQIVSQQKDTETGGLV